MKKLLGMLAVVSATFCAIGCGAHGGGGESAPQAIGGGDTEVKPVPPTTTKAPSGTLRVPVPAGYTHLLSPSVAQLDGGYVMAYVAATAQLDKSVIVFADSKDGATWASLGTPIPAAMNLIGGPSLSIHVQQKMATVYYHEKGVIGIASSTDLKTWTKKGAVLVPAVGDVEFGHPNFLETKGAQYLFYTAKDTNNLFSIRQAVTDGVNWKKVDVLLKAGAGERIFDSSVIYDGNLFRMYYTVRDANNTERVFTAISSDLKMWKQVGEAIGIGGSGDFDALGASRPSARWDGLAKIYYTGLNTNQVFSIGYAEIK